MYADRVEETGGVRSSIKDRLNGGGASVNSAPRKQITGKRQRQEDETWEHDLYKHQDPQVSNPKVGARDLRLKLQKKNIQQVTQSSKGSLPTGVRDLREKFSGTTYSQQVEAPPKLKPVHESSKTARKAAIPEVPLPETKRISSTVSKQKTQQKAETVDTFLQAIGLEKYSIIFQAEEVDMTALLHMNVEDLKVMGLPMGPRKKILLALQSKT